MNATDKKKAERYFVEHIQRYYPGYLPDVSPRDFEGPDFLIEQADCSLLGLEVTQLFHPRQGTAFPELQVAQFHRDIVRLAGEIHQSQHPERPVDVATYYDSDVRLRDRVLLLVQDPGEMYDLERAIAEPRNKLRRAEGNLQA